ncbi:SusC/RagA family TonB-linked outer membrane protein [Pedobacter heparinus]|uniref:SusC/RagA family TonB-linked outer membrane protein n=1 Tax=Pedobacter heparinus TaxID=984 RepID=UPI00292ED805|nr:SusC/RagA family TonB-linked outer membrane protein [Pedobacter heparinus]
MLRKIFILTGLLYSLCIGVYAQQTDVISGIVYDESKKSPFPGVTVMLVNRNNLVLTGITTNGDGKFRLKKTAEADKIVFSYVGYKTQEFSIGGKTSFEVILMGGYGEMDEVKIVSQRSEKADLGFMTIDKKESSSAIASVNLAELRNLPVTSVEQLIQGAAPGLQVVAASGDPGAAASIRIRGISSISGINDPLWVIDGREVIGNDYKVESITDFGFSPIGDIDPTDIESIDVLKDASATALYGSKGANGVIVIRTKRGKKGKPEFSFTSKLTMTEVPKTIPMMSGDEQRIFSIESYRSGVDDGSFLQQLRGDLTRRDAWQYNNNTDWIDVITRNGYYQQYNTSLSGGGERVSYYWGVGYTTQYGTTKGTGYDRFNNRFNLDYKVSDRLKVSAELSYINSMTDKRGQQHPINEQGAIDFTTNEISPMLYAREIGAFYPVYSENGLDYFVQRTDPVTYTSRYNPLAVIDYSTYLTKSNRFMASTVVDYKILKNLDFRTQIGVDFRESGDEYFLPGYATASIPGEALFNAGLQAEGHQLMINNNSRLIWSAINKTNHRLTVVGVMNLTSDSDNSTTIAYSNGASPKLRSSDASAVISRASGGFGDRRNIGAFIQGHYALKDRYFLTATGKMEGDSRYGKDNLYTVFPAIGASWEMTKEGFLKNTKWISSLKPRFAFGITGNLPNVTNLYDVAYSTGTGYLGETYTYPSKFAYDNIKPENTTEYNYGLDIELFDARIRGQIDYYTRTTTDLLLKETLSSTLGYETQFVNFGTLRNSGFEFGLNAVILKGGAKALRWSSFFNIATNKNRLLTLPDNLDEGAFTTTKEGFTSKLKAGDVVGGFYGYRAKGVYPTDADAILREKGGDIIYEADGLTPKYMRYGSNTGHQFRGGDMVYEDINGDGIINELDKVQIGDGNPVAFGGWNNSFTLKNWMLQVNFQYQYGNDVINLSRKNLEKMHDSRNQAQSVTARWRKQGDITDMPRAERLATWNQEASTRWVEDASYLRLKTVSLTYNFSNELTKKLGVGIRNMSVFLTAYNLYTWTNYLGIDPEVPITGSVNMFGIDNNITAPARQYTFGLRLSL